MSQSYAQRVTLPDHFTVRFTPKLLRSLTSAWQAVGQVDVLAQFGLSYYARQRIAVEGRRERIAHLVACADQRAGQREIEEVLAGSILVGTRIEVGRRIQSAGAVAIALDAATRGEPTTPATCAAYMDIAHNPDRGATQAWQRYSAERRAHLLDLAGEELRPPAVTRDVYAKVTETPVIAEEPILRAGLLWLLLRQVYISRQAAVGLAGVVYHELVSSGLDPSRSFSFPGGRAINPLHYDQFVNEFQLREMMETGDATKRLERFASEVSLALSNQRRQMQRFASELCHLPQGALAAPDDIDRAIFERLRALGHVKTRELIEAMGGTLPMRTLQRRLQGMVKRGLIEKTGARKDARYRIAEGF